MLAAVAILLGFAGWHSLVLIAFALTGACTVVAGLANRGARRWLALILVIAAPVLLLVTFARASMLWVAILQVALMLASAGTARTALRTDGRKCRLGHYPCHASATPVPGH